MKQNFTEVKGALLKDGVRTAGKREIDNRVIEWEEAYQITILPYGEAKGDSIRKYTVAPEYAEEISRQLENVYWGSIISLEFDDKMVVSVTVLCDCTILM